MYKRDNNNTLNEKGWEAQVQRSKRVVSVNMRAWLRFETWCEFIGRRGKQWDVEDLKLQRWREKGGPLLNFECHFGAP